MPLRVKVAAALGCRPEYITHYPSGVRPLEPFWSCGCPDSVHDGPGPDGAPCEGDAIANYDTDWAAGGPLIEKHGIELSLAFPGDKGQDGFEWTAWRSHDDLLPGDISTGSGPTPLEAVANLIVALSAAGKLPKEK